MGPIGKMSALLVFGVAVLAATEAFATASDPCQAPANQQSSDKQTTKDAAKPSGSVDLSRCGGVVKPPATGDQQLVEPAPKTGNMPVIPPEAVPGQQTPDATPQ